MGRPHPKQNRLRTPSKTTAETLDEVSDDVLLSRVGATLEALVGPAEAVSATDVAADLLEHRGVLSQFEPGGLRALLYQMTRNRDPEMQANHLMEMRLARALSRVPDRRIEIERLASGRNERRVDFALDDPLGTTLVEVKNLNTPLFKKAGDPMSEALRAALKGGPRQTDLHLVYLFFRRPRPDELPAIVASLREQWAAAGRGVQVFFTPAERPRIGALVVPARADTGGRVIVYDHGQHLNEAPGSRLRVVHHDRQALRRPRERIEEMFVKDNILRRLQDAEQKFPLDGSAARAVLFCQGTWAPVSHVDRCLDEAVRWYLDGRPAAGDTWAAYYPHWARRWGFTPLYDVDGIYAVRPLAEERPDEGSVDAGDVTFRVRTVFERVPGLAARIFRGTQR